MERGTKRVIDSCNGFLCISVNHKLYIWNPSNRKIKGLPPPLLQVPQGLYPPYPIGLGFGFLHKKNDYKVVRILVQAERNKRMYKIEVYSLRLNSWRELTAALPLWFYIRSNSDSIHVNGVVYWIVSRCAPAKSFILSFDMDNEVFQRIQLPDSISKTRELQATDPVSIRLFEKSLSLIHLRQGHQLVGNVACCDIWVMGVDTWKMLSTILLPQVILHSSVTQERMAWPLSRTEDRLYIAWTDEKTHNRYELNTTVLLYDRISQEA
ncbi:F-box/kelch-repeat protein At3g06240-like [Argentina anserina]|uniref:F-box/kelch-repeat protein At3g06240-like n=1 Tax=Argentina anserina TaxID=57926 RepID=UPI00217648E9|nr:F-box/kelch-repeat protein At3g06240-like [Potentilla anserina]